VFRNGTASPATENLISDAQDERMAVPMALDSLPTRTRPGTCQGNDHRASCSSSRLHVAENNRRLLAPRIFIIDPVNAGGEPLRHNAG
jgi:hypothetical protein